MSTGSRKIFENTAPLAATLIVFDIDRASILKKDTLFFTDFWDLPRIARAGRLRDVFGKVLFHISGYDSDERGIAEIPEVRDYLRQLAEAWPYFFYAAHLDTEDFLWELLKCMLPSMTVIVRDDDKSNATTQVDTEELNKAYGRLLHGMAEVCKLDSEMTQDIWNTRVEAIQTHLQKHFHAG